MSNKDIEKLNDEAQKHKYKCKNCGHRKFIPRKLKKDICDRCGFWVYKDAKDEFKERLVEERRKWK